MDYRENLLSKMKSNGNKAFDDKELFELSNRFIEYLKNDNVESFKLYRYMPFNYNNLRSIEKGEVYLSELSKMNDIFEGLSLSYPKEEINLQNLHDLAYMKAFSEEKNNLLMWSHYGDNHKGLCVEYDLKQLIQITNGVEQITNDWKILYHLFPVLYSCRRNDDKAALSNLIYAAKSIEEYKFDLKKGNGHVDIDWHKDIKSLFLIKSKGWDYEKEWRIIVTFHQLKGYSDESAHDKSELYELNEQDVSFDCISSIYCGASLSQDKLDHLKDMVLRINDKKSEDRRKINLYRCSLNHRSFKLDENLIV